ncbi:1-acylglycerol-3-phosphate O-acyltransferase [Litoribrevibacter euphylliae]|uniref:1-acyl-sn-glycerol-3-phosphate acyltransferase n=1 Tax=Litoribrevibacter euphylliae TaxID=1834034 RepID=A0ABV7HD73_9GAMM
MLVIRIPLAVLFFLLIAAVGTLACLARPFNPDNTRLFANIYSKYGLKILGIKLKIHNFTLKRSHTAVYIANHQDNLDLFVCGSVVPYRTVTIGKKSLKYLPLFGQLYWLAGNIFIDRKNSQKSAKTLDSSTIALQKNNTSIWVFAEGTRNRGKNILPFKSGAFRMAIEAQVPIIPICISSYKENLKLNKFVSGHASIRELEPIPTQGLTLDDTNELREKCWQLMKEEIEKLDQLTYAK